MWAISQNPTNIIIQRSGKLRMNGKITRIDKVLEPQTVRIYVKGGSENNVIETAGERTTDRYYGLLADYQADIMASTEISDIFYVDSVKYDVKSVFPQRINGQIVGYQCQIERVL